MTTIATLALILALVGVAGAYAQAFGVSLGFVSPGWLGVGLMGLAYLLTSFPG